MPLRWNLPRSTMLFWLGWGVAAFFIGAAVVLLVTTNRVRDDLQRAQERVQSLTRGLQSERRWLLALVSPGARTATFATTPAGDATLRGRATVDPKAHRALLVFHNFNAPGGQVYELWALRGNTPVTLGPIAPDADGRAVLRLEGMADLETVSAFVISLEPEGGAPTPKSASPLDAPPAKEPTGPIVMIGSLEG